MSDKIMVISPHADDETLGAGGTLLRYKHEGKKIFWLNVTHVSEEQGYDKKYVDQVNAEIAYAQKLYKFDEAVNLCLKPASLDEMKLGELVALFSKYISRLEPDTLILPFPHDVHTDHAVVFKAAYACTKSFRYPYIKRIMCMEVASETEFGHEKVFSPNYFVNISAYLQAKLDIMSHYSSELDEHPFPRSLKTLEALALFRGSQCGSRYAEAFELIKMIE